MEEFNPLDLLNDSHSSVSDTTTASTGPELSDPQTAATSPTQAANPQQTDAPAPRVAPVSAAPAPAPSDPKPSEPPAPGTVTALERGDRAVYRRRQMKLAVALVAVIAGCWYLAHAGIPGAAPSPSAQARAEAKFDATPVPGMAAARTDQDAAKRHYTRTGTYRGFTVDGAYSASSDDVWTASRLTRDVCVMYAMRGVERTEVAVDPTKVACTASEMEALQGELDAEQAASEAADAVEAADAFAHLSRTVAGYTTTAYDAGAPTLLGLPETGLIDGLRIVENNGDYVIAQHQGAGACTQATIGVDGTVSETTPC